MLLGRERSVVQFLHARLFAGSGVAGNNPLTGRGVELGDQIVEKSASLGRIFRLDAGHIFLRTGAHGTLHGLILDSPYFTLLMSFDRRCIFYCQREPPK